MQWNPYLTFNGQCEAAFKFYERCLGGELALMPFSEMQSDYPREAKDRIVHAKLIKGSATIMASDTTPGMPFQQGNSSHICLICESLQETERLFAALSDKGKITMPLQDTFWGARFGMITDQFGVNWMLNFDKPHHQ